MPIHLASVVLPGAVPDEEPDGVSAPSRFISRLFGPRSHPQVSQLMGDLLNVPGGHFEQGVSQLGRGPGNSQLVADIRHVAINRVEPRLPDAEPADCRLVVGAWRRPGYGRRVRRSPRRLWEEQIPQQMPSADSSCLGDHAVVLAYRLVSDVSRHT